MVIELREDDFLGRGGTKMVYRHPSDPDLCVKIPRKDKKGTLKDLLREISYLKKHQSALPFLSRYRGEIDTNQGIGYTFDLVRDENGDPSQGIQHLWEELNTTGLRGKISQMHQQLVERHAVVNDLQFGNLFVRRKRDGDYDLILVDGFGNTDYIKICDYSKLFLLMKLKRKFKKLAKKLEISDSFLD